MDLEILFFITICYAGVLTIEYFKLKREYLIAYSNYQNCLMALKDCDSHLEKYLKENGKIRKENIYE